ncbi:hypothetical protein L4X63_08045 [Geomonas sp. Red32]|uniref:hypothetical protein n=1 Tax=Geomonas sp. Red32 TaxID=2912856 RepID=UPI00202CE5D3|nr:hypothetical protein [Geomonas sp. Red32]MCM0081535.1 hypothetical protein [Geomonas sp. Red32]
MIHAYLLQIAFIVVFFVIPGLVGGWIAWTKGRNPFLWFLLNTLFPPTLMVTIFQGPARAVPGRYRECPNCHEFSKWRETVCRFCKTDLAG